MSGSDASCWAAVTAGSVSAWQWNDRHSASQLGHHQLFCQPIYHGTAQQQPLRECSRHLGHVHLLRLPGRPVSSCSSSPSSSFPLSAGFALSLSPGTCPFSVPLIFSPFLLFLLFFFPFFWHVCSIPSPVELLPAQLRLHHGARPGSLSLFCMSCGCFFSIGIHGRSARSTLLVSASTQAIKVLLLLLFSFATYSIVQPSLSTSKSNVVSTT